VVVDVALQKVYRLHQGRMTFQAVASTSARGIGGEDGSLKTPPGWHRVHRRIGEGAPPGMIFDSREATGELWRGEAREEDLILTRILQLQGLEPGVNQGPGVDSLDRYIYVHGTNQESRLGEACSHGCVRLANDAILELFQQVEEGEPVVIVHDAELPGLGLGRLHFAGVAGSGMSALAQASAMLGTPASGSDRSFDRGERPEARALLEAQGVRICTQDGSGVEGDCCAVVCSTAVEDTVPDVVAARRLGVPVLHRSELLAHFVAHRRTIAVSGTSGKSTTTAMVFELLRGAGRDPSVLTGGDLIRLQEEGLWGNAYVGASDLLVIEADESDGSLVRYHPAIGVALNLQRDHKEPEEVLAMFQTLRAQSQEGFVVSEDANLIALRPGSSLFGFGEDATFRAEQLDLQAHGSRFVVKGETFTLPLPGRHNVANALAALAACAALGVPLKDLVAPLAAFRGVGRRFQIMGIANGITVIDDYAHNPAKVEAAILAAQLRSQRVLAVFQPHGFGPLKFMREELVEVLRATLRPEDRLWFMEIFYPGGTVTRDISSGDVVADLQARGVKAELAPDRQALPALLAQEAKAGDLILLMGARDPSLPEVARAIAAVVAHGQGSSLHQG
jgi:UDP-N-acetylmuramate--L-alanine ligase